MNVDDIRCMFNRAAALSFSKKKLLLVSIVLGFCGLLIVFCRGLAVNAGQWMVLSLGFLPVFLCSGVLLSTGIFLSRVYHDEIKNKGAKYRSVLARSWETIIGASYFAIPILLCYLLLWMLLGIFVLLKEIPGVGEFFGSILAFAPFLLNLSSLVLCLFSLAMLYIVTPVVALKGVDRLQLGKTIAQRIQYDFFLNMVLGFIAVVPLLFFLGLLITSAFLTGSLCYGCTSPIHNVVQWFFIMIPFAVILSPAVIFFFNFAAEAHAAIMKYSRT